MKKRFILGLVVLLLVLTSIISGCGSTNSVPAAVAGTATPTPSSPVAAIEQATATPDAQNDDGMLSTVLQEDYADALSVRNQLALGTLRLEGTANAITSEQAQNLKLYWQALLTLSADSTSATEETTALQTQIVETMTPTQLEAIKALALTNTDLNEFYVEQGVVLTTPEPGVTPQTGKNSGLTQEQREATKTAAEALGTPVGTGGGGGAERRDILLNTLITLLTERADA